MFNQTINDKGRVAFAASYNKSSGGGFTGIFFTDPIPGLPGNPVTPDPKGILEFGWRCVPLTASLFPDCSCYYAWKRKFYSPGHTPAGEPLPNTHFPYCSAVSSHPLPTTGECQWCVFYPCTGAPAVRQAGSPDPFAGLSVTESAPPVVPVFTGFVYAADPNALPFSSVAVAAPLPGGDGDFVVGVGGMEFPLVAGERFDFTAHGFPDGVESFRITGIDPAEQESAASAHFEAILAWLGPDDASVDFTVSPILFDAGDDDGDGVLNSADNCKAVANPTQAVGVRVGLGDAC